EQIREQIEVMDGVGVRHADVRSRALESGEPAGGKTQTAQAARHHRGPNRRGHGMEPEDMSDLERLSGLARDHGELTAVGDRHREWLLDETRAAGAEASLGYRQKA